MLVNIKKLDPAAVIPSYARPGDAGMDLTAITMHVDEDAITYGTGLSVEIPPGYVGFIHPRSSIYKTGLILANSTGVIDSGYRGEIKIKFYYKTSCMPYHTGDRVAQLIILPYPIVEWVLSKELTESERSVHGFGSTGGLSL